MINNHNLNDSEMKSQNMAIIHENETETDYFTSLFISDQCEFKEFSNLKYCSVCGDKALGYNFGVITCESCKAFFRRNANKNAVTACLFNECCEVTVNTRRFCTHCRLMKCYKVKMKKENIIDHSSTRKRTRTNEKTIDRCFNSMQLIENDNVAALEHYSSKSTGNLVLNCCDKANQDKSNSSPCQFPNAIAGTVSYNNTSNFNNESSSFKPTVIMSISKKSRFISINDKLSREGLARLLSEEEWNKLVYLHKAYIDNFFESGSMSPSAIENANLINLVNSSGFLVRKLINFAKCLDDFTSLEQSCQIALLKGAVLNSLMLRSAVEYDVDKHVWITPEGDISSDIIKAAGLFELQEDYNIYCRSFKKLLGSDEYLISITQILCLFSSDNLSLTDRQVVSDIHDKYIILLKHYLESLHGFVESRSIFVWIINNLIDLQCLTSKHGEILLRIDPTNVDPLMLEVFNMNLSNKIKNY